MFGPGLDDAFLGVARHFRSTYLEKVVSPLDIGPGMQSLVACRFGVGNKIADCAWNRREFLINHPKHPVARTYIINQKNKFQGMIYGLGQYLMHRVKVPPKSLGPGCYFSIYRAFLQALLQD